MKTDSQLQHLVLEELEWDPRVNATKIGVAVTNGIVTLSGHVATFSERAVAEGLAKKVVGVHGVANEIEVHLVPPHIKSDTDIAGSAIAALACDTMVPDDKIKVVVQSGWIKLEGNVEWAYQRDAAYRAVRNITGVRGITNLITVKPLVTSKNIKSKIVAALHRTVQADAERIQVEATDSKVILKGKVRSFAEREDAENAAWSAPGVAIVENSITVSP